MGDGFAVAYIEIDRRRRLEAGGFRRFGTVVAARRRAIVVAQAFLVVGLLTVLLIVVAIPWFSIRFTPAAEDANLRREGSAPTIED